MKLETVIQNGGMTFKVNRNHLEVKKDLKYISSLFGQELKMNLRFLNQAIFEDTLKAYKKIARRFNALVGLWVDDGYLYFDISRSFDLKDEALSFGKSARQKAIFDGINKEVVFI